MMQIGDYDPIAPGSRDCIVCAEGAHGRIIIYLEQEGSVPTVLSKAKDLYLSSTGEHAEKIAAYYVDSIRVTRLFGIAV
jgi:hypothetical protein